MISRQDRRIALSTVTSPKTSDSDIVYRTMKEAYDRGDSSFLLISQVKRDACALGEREKLAQILQTMERIKADPAMFFFACVGSWRKIKKYAYYDDVNKREEKENNVRRIIEGTIKDMESVLSPDTHLRE